MRTFWRRLRAGWYRTDTVMLAANTVAFAVFIANCWWESVAVCHAASVAPLGLQLLRARFDGESPLRSALAFGALCAGVWPLGEGVVVRTAGWWGQYLAPGPRVWDTPLYCMLVGWLASTHVYYWARRTEEFGYGRGAAVACAGLTALATGALGENLFVWARMWVYDTSWWDWGSVPAFVPVSYGIGYGAVPLVGRRHILTEVLFCTSILLFSSVGLGVLIGFFPR